MRTVTNCPGSTERADEVRLEDSPRSLLESGVDKCSVVPNSQGLLTLLL